MVDWYKHDIMDWRNGTGSLDAASYRVYHVVLHEIYLSEEPVENNEHGLAGLCRQSLSTYRRALAKLIRLGKLTLENGKLSNTRALEELEKIKANRQNAAKGGRNSSGIAKTPRKPLGEKVHATAPLLDQDSLEEKTREEETREDSKSRTRGARLPEGWRPRPEDIEEAKAKLGRSAGREFQKFQDHWKAQPGQRGVKVDWDATWRNWVRKAEENRSHGKAKSAGSIVDAWDELIEGTAEPDSGEGQEAFLLVPPRSIS